MPQYDYECKNCKHFFDEFHSIADRDKPTKKPCLKCKKKQVKKIITSPMVCDPVLVGVLKPPSDFTNHILKPMMERHKDSSIRLR